jgi:hypothetical protein
MGRQASKQARRPVRTSPEVEMSKVRLRRMTPTHIHPHTLPFPHLVGGGDERGVGQEDDALLDPHARGGELAIGQLVERVDGHALGCTGAPRLGYVLLFWAGGQSG